MKRWATLLVLLLLVGVMLVGLWVSARRQGEDADAHKKTARMFRMNLGTEPPTLDPLEANDLYSMTVLRNTLQGLTQFGPQGEAMPAVASRWTISPDGKTYTFTLRPNARWSDGKPVTAQDFVYSWRRVLDSANGSSYAYLLFEIDNAQAFYEGKIKDPAKIGVVALNDHTLQVRLRAPQAFFLQILAFSISMPVRQDSIAKHGKAFTEADHFLSNGPYRLERWDHESQIILKPNSYYWGKKPPNAGVQMLMIPEPNTSLIMYENNELDFAETTSSLPSKEVRRLKGRPDFHQQVLNAISYIGFNTQKPPFNDVRVRRAFIQAFDRTYIPKLFQSGEQPIASWISPGLLGYNSKLGYGFNLAAAKKALADAGYPNGKGFPAVTFAYATSSPEIRQMAEIAQFQWKKHLGVNVQLEGMEWKVYLKQLDTDPPHLFRIQWYVDYPDPDSFMNLFISQSGNNHTRWQHARYDALIREAAQTLDAHKRQSLYDEAQHLLLEDGAAILPLYVLPKSYLLKPNVEGFSLDALNIVVLDQVRVKPPQSDR